MHRTDVATRSRLICALLLLPAWLIEAQPKRFCETASTDTPVCLEQKWDNATRDRFWYIDQGSLLMPMKWFKQLEQAASTARFTDRLGDFGFITAFANRKLDGAVDSPPVDRTLPLGFATNTKNQVPHVGLTCAACHTGLIIHEGKKFLIDGAPSMIDFDRFLEELVVAMEKTLADQDKWNRFAQLVEPNLKAAFAKRTAELRSRLNSDRPSDLAGPTGFGRLDAFGHIFNRVVVEHLGNPPSAVAEPGQRSDAPASFPALWDIAQHSHVQWNYSAPNLGVGADAVGSLIRNVGEVLGVFGTVTIGKPSPLTPLRPTYSSSANARNLKQIEEDIAALRSPAWPFGMLDQGEVAAGRKVAEVAGCLVCHVEIERFHTTTSIPLTAVPIAQVGTDGLHDQLVQDRTNPIGKWLAGKPKGVLLAPIPFLQDSWFPTLPTGKVNTAIVTAHLALNVIPENQEGVPYLKKFVASIEGSSGIPKGVYKARPLNGIWATAPYLHNGSVPNLTELLKPAKDRMPRFCVGDRQFDPENVGFKTYDGNCPPGTTLVRTGVLQGPDGAARGSLNIGHKYGVDLSPVEKKNLIQYLKSL